MTRSYWQNVSFPRRENIRFRFRSRAKSMGILSFLVAAMLSTEVGAQDCSFMPADPTEIQQCVSQFCREHPPGSVEFARCAQGVHVTWATVDGCRTVIPDAARDECIADTLRFNGIREAVARIEANEIFASILKTVDCLKAGDIEKCFGPPRLTPPPLPDPFLVLALKELSNKERAAMRQNMQKELDAQHALERAWLKSIFE